MFDAIEIGRLQVQAHFTLLYLHSLPLLLNHPSSPFRSLLTKCDRLFERGASSVGLDFLAHPFWDKYLEFEDRLEAPDKIYTILERVVKIPMHQYARYFERFRQLAHHRPLLEIVPAALLAQFRAEVEADNAAFQTGPKGELEIEREVRTKIDNFHLETFARTQAETTKRWTYESEVKRPYFHVTELDYQQLANWRKYLDFEEAEGDYIRTVFLYERCLVTCAFYDEFWFRYARWMSAQENKQEEVRNIYQRASIIYVPISRPGIRLQYAYFEEMSERVDIARDVHQGILERLPGHVETVISWANLERRQVGLEAAIEVYRSQIDSQPVDRYAKAAFVVEWALLLWKIRGSVDEARQVFESNQQYYLESRHFWAKYFEFELAQPTSVETEEKQNTRIKKVYEDMVGKTRMALGTKRDLSTFYLQYLQERGGKKAIKEFLEIDGALNGYVLSFTFSQSLLCHVPRPLLPSSLPTYHLYTPLPTKLTNLTRRPYSIQPPHIRSDATSKANLENGHAAEAIDEATLRRGEAHFDTYYQSRSELPPTAGGLANFM